MANACHDCPPSDEWNTRVPGEPAIHTCWPDDSERVEIEMFRGEFWQLGGRRLPAMAEVLGGQHRTAIADEPAAGRRDESHRAIGTQRRRRQRRMNDSAPRERGKRAAWPRHGAILRVQKIARVPTAASIGRQRLPGFAAILCDEHARRVIRSRFAKRDTALVVEEFDARQARQHELWNQAPRIAAIVRAQHDAASRFGGGPALAAHRPAAPGVDEIDTLQLARDARRLLTPRFAAVVGMPNYTAIAHGPAGRAIDEVHVR